MIAAIDAVPVSNASHFPMAGTPEWEAMNRRRTELIEKDVDGVLTEQERKEYVYLQENALAEVVKSCPAPQLDFDSLRRLREDLSNNSGR